MNNDRAALDEPATGIEHVGNAWTRFWFTPSPTIGLRCLRVMAGLLFTAWLLSFLGHQRELFSLAGWFGEKAYVDVQRQDNLAPAPIGWSILYLAGENVQIFHAMYWGSLFVLGLFTIGVATRVTGVLTWVVVVSFLANPATSYEGDYLLGILAFYLMLGHLAVGQWSGNLTPAERLLGSRSDILFAHRLFPNDQAERPTSHGVNVMMRLLQIHFVIIMLTSVLHKLQIAEWWSGVAFWFPLHPTFKTTAESLERERANADFTLFYLSLAQYLVLAWQLAFPVFAWRTGWWRVVLLGGAVIGWVGMFFLYKLPLFGPFVLLGCLSFLRPEEWTSGLNWLRSRWERVATKKDVAPMPAPTPAKMPSAVGKHSIKK